MTLTMAVHYRPGTQMRAYAEAHDSIAGGNLVMLELLKDITDEELRKLIVKRPEHYSRFAGYLGTRA